VEVLETVKIVFQFVELLAIDHHLVIQIWLVFVVLVNNVQQVPENSELADVKCSSNP
jgi:hypothetical protein